MVSYTPGDSVAEQAPVPYACCNSMCIRELGGCNVDLVDLTSFPDGVNHMFAWFAWPTLNYFTC